MADYETEAFVVPDDAFLASVPMMDGSVDWERMDAEHRQALIVMVQDSLAELSRDVETWLPTAIVKRDQQRIGLFLLWNMTQIDDRTVLERRRLAADGAARLADLERMGRRAT